MKKIYHLSTCDTCRRILETLDPPADTELREIKTAPLTPAELEALKAMAGSYEALFNKRARLYRERGLGAQNLGETGYRDLLLEHYTFLKRPVVVAGEHLFAGNTAKTVAAAKEALHP